VAERGRLGVLQIGLVGHPGLGVRSTQPGQLLGQVSGGLGEVDQPVPQQQPERDAQRLPSWPAGVQPPGLGADPGGEVALP
jgi:hypothetical protein